MMTEIGCIADDYTGGTDVAAGLRRAGLRVALVFGVPTSGQALPPCDAVVVAMKFRTTSVEKASEDVSAAYDWLTSQGVRRFYYKYCSTFDSTTEGNIGPITDLLLQLTGMRTSVISPSSPVHGRTVYQGHLFVGDRLLSESPLRHHPLTPMTDPDLVRVLARQTAGPVGLVSWAVVDAGPPTVREAFDLLARSGVRHVVTDAISVDDLRTVVSATQDCSLLTGGAGLAEAWAELVRDQRDIGTGTPDGDASAGPRAARDDHSTPVETVSAAATLLLAGSCSAATLAQVSEAKTAFPSHRLNPVRTPDPAQMLREARAWLQAQPSGRPRLIYASATAAEREAAVAAMGPRTAEHLEHVLGALAVDAAAMGTRRFVVAGGETSGAVVSALGIQHVLVEDELEAGVPWCTTEGPRPLRLLLKSGNFGSRRLLVDAA
ncbi:four-carbon acid sugar kinase family protein [Nocardioides immobilis]|uniref:3-oxo-tetronate kinase n=1 Tax=Nocardioides immobilis TaxID=2049295 RepID=A0A417Y3E2_9ACTN|nr:3-oxo-tetronate kinase [Nocardioides immobilis]RHW27087.1 four-carbon acid sugar kinase family protein [Nocardioides immobilis]